MTSSSVRPYLASFVGSTRTSNCFASPPQALTSATPGTRRSRGRTTQSWSVRSSVRSYRDLAREEVVVDLAQARWRPGPSSAARCPRGAGPRPAAR